MRLFAIYHPVLREIPRKTGLFLCFHGIFRLFSFPGLFWTLHVFQQQAIRTEIVRCCLSIIVLIFPLLSLSLVTVTEETPLIFKKPGQKIPLRHKAQGEASCFFF